MLMQKKLMVVSLLSVCSQSILSAYIDQFNNMFLSGAKMHGGAGSKEL